MEVGTGRENLRGDILQTKNGLNETVIATRVWAEGTSAASRSSWQPVLLAPASLGSVCGPLFLHLLPLEEETEASWRQEEASGDSLTKEGKDFSSSSGGTQLIARETFKYVGTLVASQGPGYLDSQFLETLSPFLLTTICRDRTVYHPHFTGEETKV